MKIRWKTLLASVAVPLIVGGIAGLISRDGMAAFAMLNKPPLSPPGWLFPVVWTLLYILMGAAAYLVLNSGAPQQAVERALKVYGIQLVFNFFWTFWFFNLQWYFFAFFWASYP